jgi:hypothetical protein
MDQRTGAPVRRPRPWCITHSTPAVNGIRQNAGGLPPAVRQGQMYPPQRVALIEQSQPVSSQL